MTLDSRPVVIEGVCTENLMSIVQLVLCLTVTKLKNQKLHVQVSLSTWCTFCALLKRDDTYTFHKRSSFLIDLFVHGSSNCSNVQQGPTDDADSSKLVLVDMSRTESWNTLSNS